MLGGANSGAVRPTSTGISGFSSAYRAQFLVGP
jgi:hypothetical protein